MSSGHMDKTDKSDKNENEIKKGHIRNNKQTKTSKERKNGKRKQYEKRTKQIRNMGKLQKSQKQQQNKKRKIQKVHKHFQKNKSIFKDRNIEISTHVNKRSSSSCDQNQKSAELEMSSGHVDGEVQCTVPLGQRDILEKIRQTKNKDISTTKKDPSQFWPLGEGFGTFRPQIRIRHAKILPWDGS